MCTGLAIEEGHLFDHYGILGHGLHSKWNKLINAGNYHDNDDGFDNTMADFIKKYSTYADSKGN